jgi:hypothetical protein
MQNAGRGCQAFVLQLFILWSQVRSQFFFLTKAVSKNLWHCNPKSRPLAMLWHCLCLFHKYLLGTHYTHNLILICTGGMEGNLRYQPIIATFNSSAISKVSMCAVLGHRTIPWVVLRVYHDSICSPFLSHNFKFLLLIKSIMYIILLQEYPHKTYMINLISFPFLSSHLFLIQTLSTLQTLHPGAPEPPAWAAHRCRGLSWVHLSCSPYFCILPLIRFLRTTPRWRA